MATLFILCGPAGVGKSTWLKHTFDTNWNKSKSVIVSRDAIRFHELEIAGITDNKHYFSKENVVYAKYTATIAAELLAGNDVYADSTNLTKKSREKLIRAIERRVKNFDVIALDFWREDLKQRCYLQNKQRNGFALVPDSVVAQQCEQYERPSISEYKINFVFPIFKEGTNE